MDKYEKEMQEVKDIAKELYRESKSEAVVVVDEEGQQVFFECKEDYSWGGEFYNLLLNKLTQDCIDEEVLEVENDTVCFYGHNCKMKMIFFYKNKPQFILSPSIIVTTLKEINRKIEHIFSTFRQDMQNK